MAKPKSTYGTTDPSVSQGSYSVDTGAHHLPQINSGHVTLATLQNWFRVWADSTATSRLKMGRDYEYAEGNGKQWLAKDKRKLLKEGRPAIELNRILPQVEYVCGMQRQMEMDFRAVPRTFNDVRLSEIASATLKAQMDFGRVHRVNDRVFDDAVISGLGVWEVIHTLDNADDLVWGDILVNRIHPQAYIYDPWAAQYDLQDGDYMGKAMWMSLSAFREKYPAYAHLAVPGEWLSRVNQMIGSSDELGTGRNLIPELWDQATGRIRVLQMWYKVPVEIILLADEKTGQIKEFDTVAHAEEYRQYLQMKAGMKATEALTIASTGSTAIFANPMGQPIFDPQTGAPIEFATPEMANMALQQLADKAGFAAVEGVQVIKRQCRKPRVCEMVYWQILDEMASPYEDRDYPFVPYIARRWSDDPESIFGIVRNLWDPQDEYNKRYSNLLAHINSSSHSGWLNRKTGGASKAELEIMGSKPGVVVEYSVEKPQQIQPTALPMGHFNMLQTSEQNIFTISSVNNDMVGNSDAQTVSGRAIRARQAGGAVGLKPRFRNFEEALLDLCKMVFSRIQQFYPPEKIKRIIGSVEQSQPLGAGGQSIFADPLTGMPVDEYTIIDYLKRVKDITFDLVFGLSSTAETERQVQFEKGMQAAQLVISSGRILGPATYQELITLADLPSSLARALQMDAMTIPMMPPTGGPSPQGGSQPKPPANGDGAPIGGNGESAGPTANRKQAAQEREMESPT